MGIGPGGVNEARFRFRDGMGWGCEDECCQVRIRHFDLPTRFEIHHDGNSSGAEIGVGETGCGAASRATQQEVKSKGVPYKYLLTELRFTVTRSFVLWKYSSDDSTQRVHGITWPAPVRIRKHRAQTWSRPVHVQFATLRDINSLTTNNGLPNVACSSQDNNVI